VALEGRPIRVDPAFLQLLDKTGIQDGIGEANSDKVDVKAEGAQLDGPRGEYDDQCSLEQTETHKDPIFSLANQLEGASNG